MKYMLPGVRAQPIIIQIVPRTWVVLCDEKACDAQMRYSDEWP